MGCYSPLQAWKPEGGGKLQFSRAAGPEVGEISLPCGQCIGCRLDHSVGWATRVMHESQMHKHCCFVTLTYSDAKLPYGGVLHYRHFQLFMKRLRRALGPVRFFMCGEYGERSWRPHYHACLFGAAFGDRYHWRTSSAGFPLFRSPLLESFWEFGSAELGELSFESAAYVARYCTKKITGDRAEAHYCRTVPETGEVISLPPEFAKMSLKPGIGFPWFEKYKSDLFARDSVNIHGRDLPIPRFYKNLFTDDELSDYSVRRYQALQGGVDGSYDRLRVREICTRARMSFNFRSLE